MSLNDKTSVSAHMFGLIVAGVSLAAVATPAMAQEVRPATQVKLVKVSIPAGPLERALLALGRQTGLRLAYASALSSGRSTAGVNGTMSPHAALSSLLSGTGISFNIVGNNVTLHSPNASAPNTSSTDGSTVLDTIRVDGRRKGIADVPYQTAGSASYISSEQIQRFRGSTAGDLFKNTPGVISASNTNGGAVNINIRGLQGQNRVRVTIDGTQQTTTTWRGYAGVDDKTYVDPDLIGGVSISKGPTGGAEGAGVNGGVVGIRTINAKDIVTEGNQYGGRLRVGAQDNTTGGVSINSMTQRTDPAGFFDFENANGSIALATVQDNFDFVMAAARRHRGNYFAGTKGQTTYRFGQYDYPLSLTKPGEEVFNTSSDSSSFLAKGTLHFDEDQSLELGYNHYESTFGEALPSMIFSSEGTFRQAKLSDVTTDTMTARYRYNPSDLIDFKANAWMSIVDQMNMSTGLAFYLPPWITPESRPPGDDPRYAKTYTYGTDLSNTSIFDTDYGQVNLSYGASYMLEDINAKSYRSRSYADDIGVLMAPSVGSRAIASTFGQASWQATDWLKLNAGLRYDRYWLHDDGTTGDTTVRDTGGGRLNPSVSAMIEPVDGLQFYALYAEGMRPPTMREAMASDGNAVPNPYLVPEVAKNWEVGINVSRDGLLTEDDSARVKLAYFRNNYTDYISRVSRDTGAPRPPGMPNYFFTFENMQKARFAGIELQASYDLGFLFLDGSLTYYTDYTFCRRGMACSDTTVGNDYAANHMPPEIMKRLTIGTRLLDDKLEAGVRITQAGARLSPVDPSARQYTGMWVPYTTVDAFATYKIRENLTLDLQAENLTDRFYIDALGGWNPSPGRTFRANLTAKF